MCPFEADDNSIAFSRKQIERGVAPSGGNVAAVTVAEVGTAGTAGRWKLEMLREAGAGRGW